MIRLQKCAMWYLKNRASYFQPSLLRGISWCQRLWAGRYIEMALFEEVLSLKVFDNLFRWSMGRVDGLIPKHRWKGVLVTGGGSEAPVRQMGSPYHVSIWNGRLSADCRCALILPWKYRIVHTREKSDHDRRVPVGWDHLANSLHQSPNTVLREGVDVCLVADPDDAGKLYNVWLMGVHYVHHNGLVGYASYGSNTIALLLSCHDWLSIKFTGSLAHRGICNIGSVVSSSIKVGCWQGPLELSDCTFVHSLDWASVPVTPANTKN